MTISLEFGWQKKTIKQESAQCLVYKGPKTFSTLFEINGCLLNLGHILGGLIQLYLAIGHPVTGVASTPKCMPYKIFFQIVLFVTKTN